MATAVSVVGLLVSSTGSALLRKVLFQLEGVGVGNTVHAFLKPWFTTWESLAACDVEQPLLDSFNSKELQRKAEQGLPVADVSWGDLGRLLVPAVCSVLQIIVQGVGLAYISASTSMVLGGSAILFTAALSTTLLKCRLGKLHWAGIFLVLFGVTIVAVANIVWPLPELRPGFHASPLPLSALHSAISKALFQELPDSVYNMIMGVSLTLLSQLLLAGQLVAEEWLLRSSVLHPLQVLGYEGLLGTIIVTIVGIPLTTLLPGTDQGGMLENWADSCAMLWRTPSVGIVNAVFFASVIGLNIFGVAVTRALGSVFRAVLLTARTALVWVVNVALWETHVGGGKVGEAWAYPTSQLQLIGFALVLLGTVIYAQGSSHVAVQYRAAKNAAQANDPSVHAATLSHATAQVTRLHAYTSVLIPPRLPAAVLRQPGERALRPRLSAPPAGAGTHRGLAAGLAPQRVPSATCSPMHPRPCQATRP
ncbi:hypothetical protein WJX73_007502 [Symbiochloris irregularis]|uniref:Solute carrier family 35 member F6 n=1 Tax=Symbiochloris irregularis TaxID=706552 RepID=A0AAW1P1H9_9CHLO